MRSRKLMFRERTHYRSFPPTQPLRLQRQCIHWLRQAIKLIKLQSGVVSRMNLDFNPGFDPARVPKSNCETDVPVFVRGAGIPCFVIRVLLTRNIRYQAEQPCWVRVSF